MDKIKVKNPPMINYDLKGMLVRLNKSKQELARAWGVSYPTIHRWVETGRVAPYIAFAAYGFEAKINQKRKAELDYREETRKTGGQDGQ